MESNWKNLSNVSAWVSPYDVFKPVFIETYENDHCIARIFDRIPVGENHFDDISKAENFTNQENRQLVDEDIKPIANVNGKNINTGQVFEYWYKSDAVSAYYVIVNMTPGEKITVQSLMGDDKPLFLYDTYEQARIALWQDIYKRVDELDLDEIK